MNLVSAKVGMHAWSYSNDYNPSPRAKMTHEELVKRFSAVSVEVELGFTPEQTAREVQRCLNCDIETHFTANLCIECDACVDVCPENCLTITPGRRRGRSSHAALGAGDEPDAGHLRLRRPAADEARHGEGRGRLPALRTVRRALSDGGVGHAEVRAGDSVCVRDAEDRKTEDGSGSGRCERNSDMP